jgi:hypothetical protein
MWTNNVEEKRNARLQLQLRRSLEFTSRTVVLYEYAAKRLLPVIDVSRDCTNGIVVRIRTAA